MEADKADDKLQESLTLLFRGEVEEGSVDLNIINAGRNRTGYCALNKRTARCYDRFGHMFILLD